MRVERAGYLMSSDVSDVTAVRASPTAVPPSGPMALLLEWVGEAEINIVREKEKSVK